MASVPAAVALVSVSYLLYRRRSLVAQLSTAAAAHSPAAEESAAEHQRWLLRQRHRAENREAASTARHDSRVPTSRLPLLPIDSSEVDGAGTVLHSRATPGVQRVVLCLVGLGSNKEKFSARRRSAFEQAGYAVVIADHYNEGARRDTLAEPLTNRQGWEQCQSAHFWKAIYATACGVPQLIDFALRTYGDDARIVAYGQSMGGDCFLTGLGFERRLSAVVLDRSCPDWKRPDSQANTLGESDEGQALYARHCPCQVLEAFAAHPTAMLFLCGAADVHVPRACAEAFVARLRAEGAYTDPTRLRLAVLPSGGWCGHIFRDNAEVTRQTLAFFAETQTA